MGSRTLALMLLIALTIPALLSSGCADKQEAKVVFDTQHRPIFSSFEKMKGVFTEKGLEVVEGGIDDLGDAAYILTGPAHRVYEKEIVDFVKSGGVLVIMIHIPPTNLMPLLKAFGMSADTSPIEHNVVKAIPSVETELSRDVESIVLYGAFRVSNPVFVEDKSVVRLSGEEKGVVGMKRFGEGYVILIGDDAAFMDTYIDSADNLKFVENLAEFILKNGKG
ncbi:MAG: hypothetical protein GXO67_07810 [Archaeoglobi archaeon]|nr:hypothetical protein [Archaeoglobi archaeon]